MSHPLAKYFDPEPEEKTPGLPYRYILEANSQNVEIRLCSIGIAPIPVEEVDEIQYALAVFKQGGCLMARDGKLSILPPPILPGATKPQ